MGISYKVHLHVNKWAIGLPYVVHSHNCSCARIQLLASDHL